MLPLLKRHIDLSGHPLWRRTIILVLGLLSLLLFLGVPQSYAAPNAVTWPQIRLQLIADGFDRPVDVVSPNDGTNRLFVVEKGGLIHIIENGVRLEDEFLDIASRVYGCPECGLLGLAFPPDFAESGYFYVNYTSDENLVPGETGDPDDIGDTVIARYRVTDDPNVADNTTEEKLLVINQPAGNHNGGHIFFGPDGYLYIGMGDGGGEDDSFNNAQDPASLLGKILRIEVGAAGTYTVPEDNPFVDDDAYRDEIWAMGLRNPWRFNFDRVTGDLYVADVGQENTEEVNHIPAGEIGNGGMNFGWPIMEGHNCHKPGDPQNCDRTDLISPVATYSHDEGCSITGGYVYHSSLPNQAPVYLYADYCRGTLWGLQRDGDQWLSQQLDDFDFQISSFGEDEKGNIYLVSYRGPGGAEGAIYQILDQAPARLANLYLPNLAKAE